MKILFSIKSFFAQYISWVGFLMLAFILIKVMWISYCAMVFFSVVSNYDVEAHNSYDLGWLQSLIIGYIALGMYVTGPAGIAAWITFCQLLIASVSVWSQFHLWPLCLSGEGCQYNFEPVEMDVWQFGIKCILIWALLFVAGYWQWFIILPWLVRRIFNAVATRLGRKHHRHSDKGIHKDSSAKEIVVSRSPILRLMALSNAEEIVASRSPVLRVMALLIHSCVFILYFCYLAEMWVYVVNDYISPDLRIYYTHPFIYALIFKVLFFAMILFIQSRLKYFSLYLLGQSMLLSMFLGIFVIFSAYAMSVLYICFILWLMVSNYRKYFRSVSTAS